MGDRGHVFFKDSGVYLYTHWGAYRMADDVARALARKQRWDDEESLARIVFDEMRRDASDGGLDSSTGFGIGTQPHGDVRRYVNIDVKNRRVEVTEHEFGGEWVVKESSTAFGRFIDREEEYPPA